MPKIALIALVLFSLAALASLPSQAAGPGPGQSGPPKGYRCHDEAITGSGPGFKSSLEESEEAAIANWLEKAAKIYPDADWNKAKDPVMQCVAQGLYRKCFATGMPCQPKSAD